MKRSARLLALGSMGLEFAVAVVGCLLVGMKIDDWLESGPIGTIVGILLGSMVAIFRVFTYLKFLNSPGPTEDESR